jgi:ribosomal protein L31E
MEQREQNQVKIVKQKLHRHLKAEFDIMYGEGF